ncbi:quinone oxidoreductase [Neofusicoccum ribis]|uniref:Quinone oxidoreductase n=1 Tax=Neofusicoccum ribis TaxID=45134 RepID=A0ABR3SPY9_9PEZI
MASPTSTRQWILTRRPDGSPILSGPASTFTLITTELPPLQDSQVVCRVKYISNDPGQRAFIHEHAAPDRFYVPSVAVGSPMRAGIIGEVVASRAPALPAGQTVMTMHLGLWSELVVLDASDCQVLADVPGLAVTHFLGALGAPGFTAWSGVKKVLDARPEHTLVVSGAGGATGSMVVQVAKKLIGCKRVVGLAGTDEKCDWVKSLGADECLNYKSPSFEEDLAKATEGYVDVYFDNVGGRILDLMLTRMKKEGTIAVCGAISTYNATEPMVLKNWIEALSMRLTIRGFILLDYVAEIPNAIGELVQATQEGKITLGDENETVVETDIKGVPSTWMKLFEGWNKGKLITKLV